MKKYPTILHRPKIFGATLIVGLIFLAIISLVSIYSMRTSSIQEKITANQRNKTVSLMAAEFGANLIVSKVDSKECTSTQFTSCVVSTPTKVSNAQNYNAYWVTDATVNNGNPTVSNGILTFTVVGTARDSNGTEVLARSRIQFSIQPPVDAPPRVAETGGNVQVSGRLTLGGSGHTNGNWEVSSGNNNVTGTLSAKSSTINVGGLEPEQYQPNMPEIDMPTVESLYPTQLSGAFSACNFTSNENLNGAIRRCSSVTFAGPVLNGTIVVNGNVTIRKDRNLLGITLIVNGNIDVDSNANNVIGSEANRSTLAATGNIEASGNVTNVYADLITNGNVIFTGFGNNSQIVGKVAARGNIQSTGGLKIVSAVPFTPASPTSVTQWNEVF
jgi:hypothetical protein